MKKLEINAEKFYDGSEFAAPSSVVSEFDSSDVSKINVFGWT